MIDIPKDNVIDPNTQTRSKSGSQPPHKSLLTSLPRVDTETHGKHQVQSHTSAQPMHTDPIQLKHNRRGNSPCYTAGEKVHGRYTPFGQGDPFGQLA
jgi:hypothetical protein